MLVELAAANAAFAIIKKTLCNGKELLDAGKAVTDYFGASTAISKEVATKGKTNALEAYQAQQQLMRQEEELKQMLNKQSMLGYHDFLQFKAQFAREQREAAKAQARKKYQRQQALEENVTIALKVFSTLLIILAALFGVAIYLR
jgi:TfoX/Sxy family transcriptional regulator of competence genes